MVNKLRDLRLSMNLSQIDAAAKIGSNDIFISKAEMGKTEIKLKEAVRLAYIYGVTLDDIYIATKSQSELCR
ncbi:helix-turn-helix domain-containing protein [Clostridium senegalense]|uniref:helix-turn-helix transcriptional regulator n=1 Tax=Clostridium senegalense TaxID=1465809 RepID=UPI001C122D15|nr:helix-turn-helix transcriptional regulator [Clostridium senegalense]MBU5228116.1 helix-turn-helix domain-containing protein [Clostridium senegalense]